MKKYDLKNRLALANHGHALTITSYWVQDSWLLRIADQRGKRLGRAHALIPDQRATQADFDALNMMMKERDKLEKCPPSPELKPDFLMGPDPFLDDPRLDGPDLDGLPDYADEAEDPDAPDVGKGPAPDASVFFNIPEGDLIMSKPPRQPKPRKPRQVKPDNHFPLDGVKTILIRPGDPILYVPPKHRKKGGPE